MKPTNLFIATIVCAVAICIATTASAGPERIPSKEIVSAPVEVPFSWTGFYIGGNLGGVWNNYEFSNFFEDVDVDQQADQFFGDSNTSAFTNGKDHFSFGTASFLFPGTGSEGTFFDAGSDDGFIGGGQVGYNKQWGHWVFGVEGDFDSAETSRWRSFSGTMTTFFDEEGFAVTDVTANRRAETDWQASARGRFGWASGHVLLYITGGAAWAHINVFADDTASTEFFEFDFGGGGTSGGGGGLPPFVSLGSISNSNSSSFDDVLFGWTGGAGGEWAFTDKMSVAVEYRHSDFGDHTYNFDAHGGPIFPGPMKVNLDSDQVTVRFNILLSHFFGH